MRTADDRVMHKMFIDATYEGDLMGAAGVTYTVMREGDAKYGRAITASTTTKSIVPASDTSHARPERSRERGPGRLGSRLAARPFPRARRS